MEMLIDYFQRVAQYDWRVVVIELVLIGFVIYWAVDFLEGTRGERLFRGVVFILIAGVLILNMVGEYFGFIRLQYLYKGFLVAVLVIAVAAFQPEVRRALIRLGRPRFLAGSSQQLAKTIEEIVSAVMELSSSQTGAIIVIEKRVALGEFTEMGVMLDAKVTSELLRTIFKPGTTLHDMAIVIHGDRIIAARVQLPLAEADSINGIELGSRHRAAVGITLSSDATVIVVSEETGIISIVLDGKLIRNVRESQLRKHLTVSMLEVESKTKHFWKFHGKNKNFSDTTQ